MGSRRVVLVCGLGRCGSSLMMQMLDAGGLACRGAAPDYEPPTLVQHYFESGTPLPSDWFDGYEAVKILDPHQLNWRQDFPAVVLWLDRDPTQQALSAIKMLRSRRPDVELAADAPGRFRAFLVEERPECMDVLAGWPRLELRFEDLVTAPAEAMRGVAEFLGDHGIAIDAEAALDVVVPRGPECQPDTAIEDALEARAAGGSEDGDHA